MADEKLISRAQFNARLLGLNEQDERRFVQAVQDYHAGKIDQEQLMKAMEKTDGKAA